MKVFIALVLSLISVALAQETFLFPNNGTACVKATFDADFELSFTDGNETYFANFSLPAESDISVDGSCAVKEKIAGLDLNMTSNSSVLSFTFTNKDGKVSADLQFVLNNPSEIFKNLNYSAAVGLIGRDVEFSDMGGVNQSYLCNAVENVTLSSSNVTGVDATVSILFSKLQIQAFNFKGNFSDPDECTADQSTTVSTTLPTTTLPTPTGTGHYNLTVGNDTCAVLVANITVMVDYTDMEGKKVSREVMIPADANVTGSCGGDTIDMTLNMAEQDDSEANGTLTFTFENDKGYTLLTECGFSFSFNDSNSTVSMNSKPDVAFSLTSKFYQCDQQVIMVGNQDSVTLRDIKVQAFGLTDGDFSSNKLDCHESVPKTAPTQNYTVVSGNTTCISMSAALTLEIKYTLKNNTNETVMVNFQKEEPASGSCSSPGNLKEEIIIKYKQNDFQILLEFGRDGKATTGLGAETFNYYIENIQITYNLGSELFPGANDTTVKTAKALNQTLYKTGSDKYYKCSAEDTFKVNDWVSLKTKDLRFVAFHTDTKEPNLFGDNANECTADTVTNSIVPIAVGAALAGLVVIVLIAYLIGRRRNHKGYESV